MTRSIRYSLRRHAPTLAVVLLAATLPFHQSAAQPVAEAARPAADTLVVGPKVESGGYGAPEVRFTRLAGHDAILVGARGGWIIDHAFVVGVAGFGSASRRVDAGQVLPSGRAAGLEFGYGGVDLGWVSRPGDRVHLTLGLLLGGGAVSFNDPARLDDGWIGPTDEFLVVEPSAALELRVTRSVRVAAGGGYRIVTGARSATVRSADLRAPAAGLTLKLGRF
jgi:hypothetical protein